MKKTVLLILTIAFMLSGCVTFHWQLGESSAEFFSQNKHHRHQFELVRHSTEWTVYKTGGDQPLFFYFHFNSLYQVDRGERSPDIIIQNRN